MSVGTGREFPWSTSVPETARFRATVFSGSDGAVTSGELALAWASARASRTPQANAAQTSAELIGSAADA